MFYGLVSEALFSLQILLKLPCAFIYFYTRIICRAYVTLIKFRHICGDENGYGQKYNSPDNV